MAQDDGMWRQVSARLRGPGIAWTVAGLILVGTLPAAARPAASGDCLAWDHLARLPDTPGVAGCFAGVVAGDPGPPGTMLLVVAGGANFPDRPPWEGGAKSWHDSTWVLSDPGGRWQPATPLPTTLAYGVSASYGGRLWCVGGGDATRHHRSTLAIHWDTAARQLVVEPDALPPLPRPMAFGAGVVVGSRLYVAGGQESPAATTALATLWSIDLAVASRNGGGPPQRWQEHPPWPGSPRILPVLGTLGDRLYLVSGAELSAASPPHGDGAKPAMPAVTRRYLTDAFCFDPRSATWSRCREPPAPLVAAPSPAIPVGFSQLAFLPGDDGSLYPWPPAPLPNRRPAAGHPGFPRRVHVYDTITDTWRHAGEIPHRIGDHEIMPAVTTPTVDWQGRTVIPSGEDRPGERTPAVLTVTPRLPPAGFGTAEWIVLAAYLAGLVAIGIACSRRERTTADFFLGGNRIPWWAAGLSIFGTSLSAITFLSVPARAYAADWSRLLLNAGIVLVAPLVVHRYLPAFRAGGTTTAYELLERRFGISLRLFGAVTFCVFQVGRMGIVVLLPALAISAVTRIPVAHAILAMGVLATCYTVLGGIEAVIWTDVLQVAVLGGGALLLLAAAVLGIEGGVAHGYDVALDAGKLTLAHMSWSSTGDALWVILLGGVFSNALVPYTTDQALVQRYLTTPDERQAARAIWLNAALAIPSTVLFFGLGTAIWCFYTTRPADVPVLANPTELVPWFATTRLPTGCAGLVVAGILAAAMSSLDSAMHSVSTVITTDVVGRFRLADSDAARLRVARGLVVALGVVGTLTALVLTAGQQANFFDVFVSFMGLCGGPLAGVFFLAVFTREVAAGHAWVGVAASIAAVGLLTFGTQANGLLAGAVGWATCVTVGWAAWRTTA